MIHITRATTPSTSAIRARALSLVTVQSFDHHLKNLSKAQPNIPDATDNVQRKLGGGPAVPL